MFKFLMKRMSTLTASGVDRPLTSARPHTDYGSLVSRIIDGDTDAEAELVDLFRDPVLHIIRFNTNNSSMVEDLSQDTFLTVIRKIRNGDVKQPESLGTFIANVARFHTIEQMRKFRRRAINEDLDEAERVLDPTPNRLEELQRSEELEEIRDLIEQLIPRYRMLLLRFYINEESKEAICADLGLTSGQFDGVLHRARKSYRALYLKHKELAEKGGRR